MTRDAPDSRTGLGVLQARSAVKIAACNRRQLYFRLCGCMRKNKPEGFRGQATMRVVVGVFLFLDFALACFLVVSL
jgi:hypothetical protein